MKCCTRCRRNFYRLSRTRRRRAGARLQVAHDTGGSDAWHDQRAAKSGAFFHMDLPEFMSNVRLLIAHGTTLSTNALLTGNIAKSRLISHQRFSRHHRDAARL